MSTGTLPFDGEDHALQEAIQESLGGGESITEGQFRSAAKTKTGDEASNNSKGAGQSPMQRVSIEDRIKDMALRAATELPVVRDPRADTWVFIDPPQKQPEQDRHDYEYYIKRYEAPISMRKDTLVKYSPILEKSFGPTAQHRIIRRRNLVKELRNSPNIKYVIDLTPPTEGEEAVYLTTELCCSEGVRLWYQASEIWKVSKVLVGGEEEYTSVKLRAPVQESSPAPATPGTTRITLEYTPVRHRSAIERVLSALQGLDPKLDSAPKVWTTFAVAKYLDIKHSELDSYIIRWLRAYPNSYFLEVLPEVSLQIADGLENYDLARDTFAILVGEEALDNLRRARKPSNTNDRSVYGRKKEDLPETIFTRVEYASKSFLERITNEFAAFVGDDMQWIEQLPEYQKLSSYDRPELQDTISYLKTLLKLYVRGAIYKLLCVNYDSVPAPDLPHAGGYDLLPRVSRSDVWIDLSLNERILSRTFWQALTSFKMFSGRTNLDIKEGWNMRWDSIKLSTVEQRELDRGTYCEVLRSSLGHFVDSIARHLSQDEPPHSSTLPFSTEPRARAASVESPDLTAAPMVPADPLCKAQALSTGPRVPAPEFMFRLEEPQSFRAGETSLKSEVDFSTSWPSGSPQRESAGHVRSTMDSYFGLPPPSAGSPVEEVEDKGVNKIVHSHQKELERLGTHPSRDVDADSTALPSQPFRRTIALYFDLEKFFLQAEEYIVSFARQKLHSSDQSVRDEPLEIGITNTLVCLQESEWKYLPLWAGGNDDGSGGVYIDQPATTDLGFSSPGPDIHTGTPVTSIKSPSELDFENLEIISDYSTTNSTANASMANNRGFSDYKRRDGVYAATSADASSHKSSAFTDDFTMVSQDDEEENARRAMEAQERMEEEEEKAAKEARRIQKGKERMIDENYADLFDEEEEESDGNDNDRADDGDFEEDEDGDLVLV